MNMVFFQIPFIETFKLIRTKIENAHHKKGYSVFAITSSTESEGKTTCSSKMLEKYDCDLKEFREKTILDPTCGSGLLLLDALIAGTEPDRVFGIELDEEVLKLAHDRLCNEKNPVKVPDLDYSGDVVTVKPYKDGDDFIEIPDADFEFSGCIFINICRNNFRGLIC